MIFEIYEIFVYVVDFFSLSLEFSRSALISMFMSFCINFFGFREYFWA